MDVTRALRDFVFDGLELFRLLRAEGRDISELDLNILDTQLYILQVETRVLKREIARSFQKHEWIEVGCPGFNTTIAPLVASLTIGGRLRVMTDSYCFPLDSVAKILQFKGMPGEWYVVVWWEKSTKLFVPGKDYTLYPADLQHFELVPVPT
jgi:hypothetical protein